MGRSNGNEAIRKRADAKKRMEKAKGKDANSQLKKNEAAMSLKCQICMQTFMQTQYKFISNKMVCSRIYVDYNFDFMTDFRIFSLLTNRLTFSCPRKIDSILLKWWKKNKGGKNRRK